MANTKISELTSLGASPAGGDIIPLTDISTSTTKSVTVDNLLSSSNFSSFVSETGTARTLSNSDSGKVINCNNGSQITVTIPSGLTSGFTCTLVQSGAGTVTIAAGGGVTLAAPSTKVATNERYSTIAIIPVASDTYYVSGDSKALATAWSNNVYACSFDGTDDYIDLASTTTLTASSGWTVSFWAKFDFSSGSRDVIGSDTDNHEIRFNPVGAQYVYVDATNGTSFKALTAVIGTSDFHHFVLRDDGTNITVFVDGSNDGTMASQGDFKIKEIAKQMGNGVYWDGILDEIAVWDTNLTDSEVAQTRDATGSSPVPVDISSLNPLHWWRMGDNDAGTGTTITDQGSSSNDGSVTNGTAFHNLSTTPDSIHVP